MNEDHRICFFGDSFTQGTSDPQCLGWPGRLGVRGRSKGYDLTVYNQGVRGETSADIARRWLPEALPRFPDFCLPYVVFSFGSNDAKLENGRWLVSAEDSVDNFRLILAQAAQKFPVIFVGPPPTGDDGRNERLLELAEGFAQCAREINIPFLPVTEKLMTSSTWVQEAKAGDGTHPQAGGYQALFELVQAWDAWWFK